MNTAPNSLARQFLEWLNEQPRRPEDALDVWRTNRPRLSAWEDACIDCLIQACAATPWIIISAIGRMFLQRHT
jgi:hypothetical protein